ncbi:hypothetical protein AMBR_MGDJBKAP_02046 [Leuconostoc pseudomesenteroides]|jgi:hypothetical protein|nr:hypothetical protein AMBR_MGDJBKAP_02046 [Leuconostoc pseudomesenteroides]
MNNVRYFLEYSQLQLKWVFIAIYSLAALLILAGVLYLLWSKFKDK